MYRIHHCKNNFFFRERTYYFLDRSIQWTFDFVIIFTASQDEVWPVQDMNVSVVFVPVDRDLVWTDTSLSHSNTCLSFTIPHSLKRTPFLQNARPETGAEDFRPQLGPLALCGPIRTFHAKLIRPKQQHMSGERLYASGPCICATYVRTVGLRTCGILRWACSCDQCCRFKRNTA